jgi:transposase
MPPFQHVSLSNVCPAELPRSTVSAVIVKWKFLGTKMAQLQSGRPHKLTEQDQRELHEMGFHGQAATHKPKITTPNVKRWLEWCTALEQVVFSD